MFRIYSLSFYSKILCCKPGTREPLCTTDWLKDKKLGTSAFYKTLIIRNSSICRNICIHCHCRLLEPFKSWSICSFQSYLLFHINVKSIERTQLVANDAFLLWSQNWKYLILQNFFKIKNDGLHAWKHNLKEDAYYTN